MKLYSLGYSRRLVAAGSCRVGRAQLEGHLHVAGQPELHLMQPIYAIPFNQLFHTFTAVGYLLSMFVAVLCAPSRPQLQNGVWLLNDAVAQHPRHNAISAAFPKKDSMRSLNSEWLQATVSWCLGNVSSAHGGQQCK